MSAAEWKKPADITTRIDGQTFPVDALPAVIRDAVIEVAGFVQAPLPMVASSALAALSLAGQAHCDVMRAERLTGPCSLFMLTIADSGERKSTCDGFFSTAIRTYEAEQAEAGKELLKRHTAAMAAHDAKVAGVKERIRQLAAKQESTTRMEAALYDLERAKPEAPRIPRLLYADATPEALAYGLAKQWPSGGIVSSEAGTVFGSHGMSKDSVMRNLAMLNTLWDGASLNIDRRTSESFAVRGARLTVALQVQEPTLREFFKQSGALARGTGFLARFLVAWPESTQGHRPFVDAPRSWPALSRFSLLISELVRREIDVQATGGLLIPPQVCMTPACRRAWIDYHDAIESELASGGELYDVRDVASKSADNAARLSGLFQLLAGGGLITPESFASAARIAAWYLSESRRFFGELALPAELADAARLDTWLIDYCRRERVSAVSRRVARQRCPVRDGARLDAAIRELVELERVQVWRDGRRVLVAVNPELVA